MAGGKLVRLAGQRRTQLDRGIPNADAVANFQIKPRQQRGIDRRAEGVAVLREQRGKRHGRIGHDFAEQRIIGIDRFDLDQG